MKNDNTVYKNNNDSKVTENSKSPVDPKAKDIKESFASESEVGKEKSSKDFGKKADLEHSPQESVKAAIRNGLDKTGNFIEKMGEKIEEKGFEKIGHAVEKFGDKIEHLGE